MALVYDRVNKWGGAERVLLALHEIFPEAPLYTAVYSPEKAPWAKVFPKIVPSFLNKIKFFQDKHEYLAPLMPLAFESFNFDEYDLVISVTSEAAKGIITKPKTLHVCYCLTPTRYLWSHYGEYFKGPTLKAVSKPIINHLRSWDKIAAQRPDVMVGISTAVQGRIKKYYERESEVIYPPVDIDRFKILDSRFKKRDYYLFVSRLIPYKRADLAVEAFNELGLPLKIVGTGSEEAKLKRIAKKNIEFFGFIDDSDLAKLYQGAKALIFPGEEDFGIVMVEALASGTPVIAYKAGGALDIVKEGKTGIFFESQEVGSLISAIKRFDEPVRQSLAQQALAGGSTYKNMSLDCIKNAERFKKENFKERFLDLVKRKL